MEIQRRALLNNLIHVHFPALLYQNVINVSRRRVSVHQANNISDFKRFTASYNVQVVYMFTSKYLIN